MRVVGRTCEWVGYLCVLARQHLAAGAVGCAGAEDLMRVAGGRAGLVNILCGGCQYLGLDQSLRLR
jgi:hypothetical protein